MLGNIVKEGVRIERSWLVLERGKDGKKAEKRKKKADRLNTPNVLTCNADLNPLLVS